MDGVTRQRLQSRRFLFLLVFLCVPAANNQCLPGWSDKENNLCFTTGFASSWFEARKYCHVNNGYLTDPRFQLLRGGPSFSDVLRDSGINRTWTGIHVKDSNLIVDGFPPRNHEIKREMWLWGNTTDETKHCAQVLLTSAVPFERPTRSVRKRDVIEGVLSRILFQRYDIKTSRRNKRHKMFGRDNRRIVKRLAILRNILIMSDCEEKLPFLCEAQAIKPTVEYASVCRDARIGNYYLNRCYSMDNSVTSSFDDADAVCEKQGKRLARYSSTAEFAVLNRVGREVQREHEGYRVRAWWVQSPHANCTVLLSGHLFQTSSIPWPCNTSLPVLCEENGVLPAKVNISLTRQVKLGRWISNSDPDNSELILQFPFPKLLNQSDSVTCTVHPFIGQLQYITWFKDGQVLPIFMVTHAANSATVHFFETREMSYFTGYYWCEVNNLNSTQTERSAKFFVRHSSMEMYAGTVKIRTKSSPFETALLNYNSRTIGPLSRLPLNLNNYSTFSYKPLRFRSNGDELDMLMIKPMIDKPDFIIRNQHDTELARIQIIRELNLFPEIPRYLNLSTLTVYSIDSCFNTTLRDERRDVTYVVPPTSLGESFRSADICLVDNKSFVEMKCLGSKLFGAMWQEPVFNDNCNFDKVEDTPVSPSLKNLSLTDVSDFNVKDVVKKARDLTDDISILNEKDLVYSADIIQKTTELKLISPAVAVQVINVASNVMKKDKETIEKSENLGRAPSRIIRSLDKLDNIVDIKGHDSLQLISHSYGTTIWNLTKRVTDPVIGLRLNDRAEFTNKSLVPLYEDEDLVFTATEAAIILRKTFVTDIIKNEQEGDIRLSMHVFADTRLFTATQNSGGRDVQFTLNSKVISAKLSVNNIPVTNLRGVNVKTVFLPDTILEPEDRQNLTNCGFWDLGKDGGLGGWSVEGCSYLQVEKGRDVCHCDHLTNFAVLMDYYGQDLLPKAHQLILGIITIVGLSLSILGLSLTVLTFIIFKKLRQTKPQQTLFNLALAQLGAWIVFLAGINQTQNNAGCIAVAVLLHYFITASFLWMLVEAVLHYLMFVKIYGSYVSNYIIKTAIPAWGIPVIPIIIVLVIDNNLYRGGSTYCWMSLQAFYFAFALPIGLIIVCNVVLYIMVAVSICRRPDMSSKRSKTSNQKNLVSIKASVFCFILLGMSWIFGYLAIADARIVFQYIFTITNTIQGFLIFLIFTLRDKQVRDSWMSLCCPKKRMENVAAGKHNVHLTDQSTSSGTLSSSTQTKI